VPAEDLPSASPCGKMGRSSLQSPARCGGIRRGAGAALNQRYSTLRLAAHVNVEMLWPDGSPAKFADAVAHNRNAADPRVADWTGRTGPGRKHAWASFDTGVAGDLYDLDGSIIDDNGVRCVGRSNGGAR
jgi:hypothetical protein